MIYKYPEEFVVPVVYANDLSNKPMYRDWELDLEIDGLIISDKKVQKDKEFMMEDYEGKVLGNKGEKLSEFDMDLLKEPYQKDMLSHDIVKDGAKNSNVKAILNEIDNEYAESETLKM